MGTPLTHDEAATAAGGFRWCELAVWRACSAWAVTTPSPPVAVCLDVLGAHAAWRADQWWDRLPVLASVDRDSLVVAPSPAWARVEVALGVTGPPDDGPPADGATGGGAVDGPAARMAVVARVLLERLAAGYGAIASRLDGPAAAPMARTLAQVTVDVAADWQRASGVLAGLLTTEGAVSEAAAATSRVERAAVAAGDHAREAAQ